MRCCKSFGKETLFAEKVWGGGTWTGGSGGSGGGLDGGGDGSRTRGDGLGCNLLGIVGYKCRGMERVDRRFSKEGCRSLRN